MSAEAQSTDAPAAIDEPNLDFELWLLAVERVGYSPVAYPLFSVVVGTMTPLGSTHLGVVAAVTISTAALGLLRLWHLRTYAATFALRPQIHRLIFRAGALSCGLIFSALSCVALGDFGVAPTSLVSLLVLAGLVSGGTASLAADLQLARMFICVTLLPPAIVCMTAGPHVPTAVPLVILCCVVFYAALAKQMASQASQLLVHTRELKRERAHLAVAKAKAEAAVIAKGAFLATMSHELRTPLNGVIGMTELLHGTALDATQRDYTETLKTAADGLLGLINDILDFSKIEAGRLELEAIAFDPAQLLGNLAKMFMPQVSSKAVALTFRIAPDVDCWVTGDPARLRQMLLNLLSNAVKFTDTGSVTLGLQRDARDTRRMRFSVSDTGTGIPSHKHAEIFTEFSQVDSSVTRRYGGTGLGLAITQRLAVAMGSEIELASVPGQGSTFSFSVLLPAATALSEAMPTDKATAPQRHLRLLVVDDNVVNLKVATRLLDRLGCSFETATNGQEACDMIVAGGYDAVLMDCMMPILDGYSATRRLRAAGIGIPILAMTANCQPEDVARCLESGMNAHLPKPIRLAELAAALAGLEFSASTLAGPSPLSLVPH